MRAWLPANALDESAVEALLLPAIREWGRHWLVDGDVGLAPMFQDDWPAAAASAQWRSIGAIASVPAGEPACCLLASAMLGCTVASTSLQPTDRKIIERIATAAIDDLLTRLAKLAAAPVERIRAAPVDLESCHWWELSLGRLRRGVKLAVSSEALITLLTSTLPKSDKVSLGSLDEALGRQQVPLSVGLGNCAISFADLNDLGTGDVLVLDTDTEAPIPLFVSSCPSHLRGRLEDDAGQAKFTLEPQETEHG